MRPSQVIQAISTCIAINRSLFLWGPPGVGKSDVVRQAVLGLRSAALASTSITGDAATAAMAAPLENGQWFGMCDFRAALRDAVDIMGLPGARDIDGVPSTFYNAPAGLPRAGWRGIVFLDEMNSAPSQTQAALYQLVLDRAVGDYKLPEGVFIVAAGNRANDRGVVHRMPDPLADRFFHVDFEVHRDDWCTWALAAAVRPEVVAFIRFRDQLLHNHDTARQCHAFSTPRGWADVSRMLDAPESRAVEAELIRGRVGDGAASEFMAFLKLYRNMVDPDEIIRAPLKAEVPQNVGTLYALAEALARRATPANIGAVLAYAKRIPVEYAQALVSSMTRVNPALCNTSEYIAWCVWQEKQRT